MKISKELSDSIYNRFLELKKENKSKKVNIQKLLRNEFYLPKSSIWDHSAGRDKKSINYSVFKDTESINKPKILFYDIEIAPMKGWSWKKYDTNIIDFIQDWYILSFSYKWKGEKKVHSISLVDFDEFDNDYTNDYYLVKELWELFNEADILVGQNSVSFDNKKSYTRFLYHGFPPPKPSKNVDTLKIARKYFSFSSNKLDDLGKFLGLGRKVVHTGWDLWNRCCNGERSAFIEMCKYNEGDVILLEKVYNVFLPYIDNHPNLNLYKGTDHNCPNCGSNRLQKRGMAYTRVNKSQRYQCISCGAWSQGEKIVR